MIEIPFTLIDTNDLQFTRSGCLGKSTEKTTLLVKAKADGRYDLVADDDNIRRWWWAKIRKEETVYAKLKTDEQGCFPSCATAKSCGCGTDPE